MSRPLRKRRAESGDHDKPDVEAARANLERIKSRRPDVERIVDALARERQLNHFTASAVIVFRGGNP